MIQGIFTVVDFILLIIQSIVGFIIKTLMTVTVKLYDLFISVYQNSGEAKFFWWIIIAIVVITLLYYGSLLFLYTGIFLLVLIPLLHYFVSYLILIAMVAVSIYLILKGYRFLKAWIRSKTAKVTDGEWPF
ncbi:hypothetical protein [Listeria booriae]|uniref:Uncharacterized protein n=1 Tax=Listeria booriae TaxID=1552123 RepID=A0A7X0XUM9_9LIST|nr:hypothetical protein [Listeria booriae]MBC1780546.1 hypothetical protein [Listeria booriae]MBC2080890.1 hypothetical protein [Listeria booriae]MBC2324603.1 hypothetical protein [Listeria booriae]MBC6301545.1 hypothetical protein [Listeria booriae]